MKIKKIKQVNKKHKYRLIKLNLLKKNSNLSSEAKDTEYRLKKALNIIYKYHLNYKRILFVSNSTLEAVMLNKRLKGTKHICIPGFLWRDGIISNRKRFFYMQKKKKTKIPKILFKLSKRSQLIVLFNQNNSTIIDEGCAAQIPVISIDYNFDDINTQVNNSTYKIPGNIDFRGKLVKKGSLFYYLLMAVLKRAKKHLKKKEKTPKRRRRKFVRFLIRKHRR